MNAAEFKQRFMPLHPKLYRVAYRLTGNMQDAEDIVQETYLRLWNGRDKLTAVAQTEVYCIVLVRNLCHDKRHAGESEKGSPPPDSLPLPADTDLQRETEARDEASLLNRLIAHLPETQRTVMQMHDIDGLTYNEIEGATQLSYANIRTLLCRARQRIREQFHQLTHHENA